MKTPNFTELSRDEANTLGREYNEAQRHERCALVLLSMYVGNSTYLSLDTAIEKAIEHATAFIAKLDA